MISITKLNRFFELNNLSYKSLQYFPHFITSIMLLFYLKLTYFSFKSLSLSLSHFLNIFHFRLRLHTIQRIIRFLSDNAFLCSPGSRICDKKMFYHWQDLGMVRKTFQNLVQLNVYLLTYF